MELRDGGGGMGGNASDWDGGVKSDAGLGCLVCY